jgi:hypothetical protein
MATRTRRFDFVRRHGRWTVNGKTWQDVIDSDFRWVAADPKLNDVEIWEFRNTSGGWNHPVHVVAGLYLASRTNGVPVGPVHAGHRLEPAGVLDLTTTAAELVLIALLVSLLPPRVARITVNVLLLAGLGPWVLRFSGLLA